MNYTDSSPELISPTDPAFIKGTVILEAGDNRSLLLSKLEAAWFGPGAARQRMVVACRPGQKADLSAALSSKFIALVLVEIQDWGQSLREVVATEKIAFLPADATYSPPPWDELPKGSSAILPWSQPVLLPDGSGPRLGLPVGGWIAEKSFLSALEGQTRSISLRDLEAIFRTTGRFFSYLSARAVTGLVSGTNGEISKPPLTKNSSVLAVIPFYHCEEWLEEALRSLMNQSRPLQGIVVVDDGSAQPPVEIVKKFDSVTLWRSPENVGPYRLIQSVIEKTGYDAYLFQDADDWSSLDRLERLLDAAEKTGADMVGSQELMYLKESVLRNNYPLDVNRALAGRPGYGLLHPSSLVSRNLIFRAGGYATGLKFSGDMEFLLRAVLVGKAVNLDRYCYFRRIRMNSLITSETTGLASPARQMIDNRVRARAKENTERMAQGLAPLLQPLETAGTIDLERVAGPDLIPASSSKTP
jgi:hypothetical protein